MYLIRAQKRNAKLVVGRVEYGNALRRLYIHLLPGCQYAMAWEILTVSKTLDFQQIEHD
jgi:hypothetical protein